MNTEIASLELARELETAEVCAWLDLYQAAPPEFAKKFQLKTHQTGSMVLLAARGLPALRFNRVLGWGLLEEPGEESLQEVFDFYRSCGVRRFLLHQILGCLPLEFLERLESWGLQPAGNWERIYRRDEPLADDGLVLQANLRAERVTGETAGLWADYIYSVYGLQNKPWLLCLVERPGWQHYMLRDASDILAVRSSFTVDGCLIWLGIEGPIPGLMTPAYEYDALLCRAIIKEGLAGGVRGFVADIEESSPYLNSPTYRHFSDLAFRRMYFRSNWVHDESSIRPGSAGPDVQALRSATQL